MIIKGKDKWDRLCVVATGRVVRAHNDGAFYQPTEDRVGGQMLKFRIHCASRHIEKGKWENQTITCVTWSSKKLIFKIVKELQVGDIVMVAGVVNTNKYYDEKKQQYFTPYTLNVDYITVPWFGANTVEVYAKKLSRRKRSRKVFKNKFPEEANETEQATDEESFFPEDDFVEAITDSDVEGANVPDENEDFFDF